MIFYGIYQLQIFWALPLFCCSLVTAVGVGLWLSARFYRDINYVLPFIQFWMFLTPIAYPSTWFLKISNALRVNPMIGVVEDSAGRCSALDRRRAQ